MSIVTKLVATAANHVKRFTDDVKADMAAIEKDRLQRAANKVSEYTPEELAEARQLLEAKRKSGNR